MCGGTISRSQRGMGMENGVTETQWNQEDKRQTQIRGAGRSGDISKAERQQNGVEANQQVAPNLGSLSPANLLHLQRTVGNQAVRRVVRQASTAPGRAHPATKRHGSSGCGHASE